MSDHAHPKALSADQTVAELAGHHLAVLQDVRANHADLLALLEAQSEPAQLVTLTLDATNNSREDQGSVATPSMSIGVLNPNSIAVSLGLGGGSATANARAVSVPPNSLLVLPVAVAQVELGADPTALGANTAVVHLLRFRTVQRAFLGKGS